MNLMLRILIAVVFIIKTNGQLPAPGDCGVFQRDALGRIIGGETAEAHSRPFQLLLVTYTADGAPKSYCGASLITRNHVLTAAHCVDGEAAANVIIYPSLHNFTSSILTKDKGVAVQTVYRHESYSSTRLTNDVAVLRLKDTITLSSKAGLVCLASKDTPVCNPGEGVVASGWGSMSGSPNRTAADRPVELRQVALECMDIANSECKPLTHLFGIIPETSKMCAYGEKKGVCFGDSGGPLIRIRKTTAGVEFVEQVGIMSGTIDCSFTLPKPDIYANVREMYSWIIGKVNSSP